MGEKHVVSEQSIGLEHLDLMDSFNFCFGPGTVH